MGRFREMAADDATLKAKAKKATTPDHHARLFKHALGLVHTLGRMKKSGQFGKKAS